MQYIYSICTVDIKYIYICSIYIVYIYICIYSICGKISCILAYLGLGGPGKILFDLPQVNRKAKFVAPNHWLLSMFLVICYKI